MPKSTDKDLIINSLRGGQNNLLPPHALEDDEVVLAENVEFFYSTLGERRRGCELIDVEGSNLDAQQFVVFLGSHLPKFSNVENCELWAGSCTFGDTPGFTLSRRSGTVWSEVTLADAFYPLLESYVRVQAQSSHGKYFICYKSAEDRMHVWDEDEGVLRRAGLRQPDGATDVANSGGAGTFAEDRVYRARFIKKDIDDHILLKSEPTEETTFTPSGTNDGAVISIPDLIDESETHWEVEASSGDGNFYTIATLDLSTTTYTDTTELPSDYGSLYPLAPDIGDYTVMESAKYVIQDQDRVIIGGAWEDETHNSRLSWTPVSNATGFGNDERIPIDTTNFIDLDWQDGGELTGLSSPVNGSFYAFKHSRIYKIQRTGDLKQAYESFLVSSSTGAIYQSIINGVDELGRGCVYFLDPALGPCRVGVRGIQQLNSLRGVWARTNTGASTIPCHGVYYPDKQQVHWWLTVDNNDLSPNYKIILQVNEIVSSATTASRGWTTATGFITTANCSTVVPEHTTDDDTGGTYLSYRPYIGLDTDTGSIARCDVENTDAGYAYRGRILTKPYIVAGLLNKWGAMNAAVLAKPIDDPNTTMRITLIRDFGKEENNITTDFVPDEDESLVNKKFDNLNMSDAYAIQVEFKDEDPLLGNPWTDVDL